MRAVPVEGRIETVIFVPVFFELIGDFELVDGGANFSDEAEIVAPHVMSVWDSTGEFSVALAVLFSVNIVADCFVTVS